MSIIESDSYRQEEALLKEDPRIIALADELKVGIEKGHVSLDDLAWPDGHANSRFMGMANAEYRRRGGTRARSIGGVSRAVLALLREAQSK